MQHPVLKNTNSIIIYSILWLVIGIVDFSFYFFSYHFSLQDSLVGSLTFGLLYGIMGIAIWYIVLYSYPEKIGLFNLLINHLTGAAIIIFLWTISGLMFIRLFVTEQYYNFIFGHLLWYIGTGFIFYFLFVLVYYLMIYNFNLKEKKKNEDRLMAIIKEAELNLLKSQINPHFLFNSLNSISSLTITNPAKAQEMIIKLSDFLRYSISRNSNQKSSLKLELENIQRYLDIEKVRFGNKLNYQQEIEEICYNKNLPVMILQPLYENAVKHGVYESTEPITLKVRIYFEKGELIISLINNFDPETISRKGARIGLRNIKERLQLTYHREGLLQFKRFENTFEVKLVIPQNE